VVYIDVKYNSVDNAYYKETFMELTHSTLLHQEPAWLPDFSVMASCAYIFQLFSLKALLTYDAVWCQYSCSQYWMHLEA